MAINRYQGNTGKVSRIAEPSDPLPSSVRRERTPSPQNSQNIHQLRPEKQSQNIRPPRLLSGGGRGGLGVLSGIENSLGGLFSRFTDFDLETEDIILLLILWLMYKESGDTDLLIIMAIMLFL